MRFLGSADWRRPITRRHMFVMSALQTDPFTFGSPSISGHYGSRCRSWCAPDRRCCSVAIAVSFPTPREPSVTYNGRIIRSLWKKNLNNAAERLHHDRTSPFGTIRVVEWLPGRKVTNFHEPQERGIFPRPWYATGHGVQWIKNHFSWTKRRGMAPLRIQQDVAFQWRKHE